MKKAPKPKSIFGRQLRTGTLDCHGVIASLNSTWRTRANNKPLVVSHAKIDTRHCL